MNELLVYKRKKSQEDLKRKHTCYIFWKNIIWKPMHKIFEISKFTQFSDNIKRIFICKIIDELDDVLVN